MTHVTCRLTAKNRDQLQDSTLGSRVRATFTFLDARSLHLKPEDFQVHDVASVLRRFIRGLDEPLLTGAKRARWLETACT